MNINIEILNKDIKHCIEKIVELENNNECVDCIESHRRLLNYMLFCKEKTVICGGRVKMLTSDIAEILLNLGNKLKENPNDLMVRVEVKEKLNRIVEDMENSEKIPTKKVKCIDNIGFGIDFIVFKLKLTLGKVYEVVEEYDSFYIVLNDVGCRTSYFKDRFEIVEV